MGKLLLALVLSTILPVSAVAGPKDDEFKVIEQFKAAFDSADVPGVVKLFAPEAVFLGTVSPKLATKTAEIETYFQGIKVDTPRKVEFGEFSTIVISDTAVAFAGMDTFSSTRDGKTTERPARFTFLVTKAGASSISTRPGCRDNDDLVQATACISGNPNLLAGARA